MCLLYLGMFLVAELVWINLCGQTSIAGLDDELASLPTDLDKLDEAYVLHCFHSDHELTLL
jgi:hypothetical protein